MHKCGDLTHTQIQAIKTWGSQDLKVGCKDILQMFGLLSWKSGLLPKQLENITSTNSQFQICQISGLFFTCKD